LTQAPKYTGKLDDPNDTAYRVIGDHVRALTVAITDGAVPSNEKRGYVVRNILRRAFRFGWQYLGQTTPFLHNLVTADVDVMGDTFPEMRANASRVSKVILDEEVSFLSTLGRGFRLFENAAIEATADSVRKKPGNSEVKITKSFGFPPKLTFRDQSGNLVEQPGVKGHREFINRYCAETPVISGKVAFDLYTEQGIYIDITEQMAAEIGLLVDREGYEELYRAFREA